MKILGHFLDIVFEDNLISKEINIYLYLITGIQTIIFQDRISSFNWFF